MSIPQAVLRQGERSDALLKAQFTQPAAEPAVVVAPAVEASSPPPSAPVESSAESTTPAVVSETVTPAAKPEQRVDWKQKYLVLEGKYRAEVPRYAADLRDARQKIQELTNKNLSLHEDNDKLRRTAPAPSSTDPTNADNFDPALIAALAATSRREVEAAVSARVAPLEERNAEHERSAAALAHQNFERDVNDYLMDSHKVGWREIDTKPEFHAYLADRDPMSGAQRQSLLNDAVKNSDSLRAAAIFQDFLNRTHQPVRHVPPTPPAADPRAHLVTPARGSSGIAVTEPEKRTYTRQEVSEFYSNWAKASVNPRTPKADLDRAKAIDQDIQLAMNEGRIT